MDVFRTQVHYDDNEDLAIKLLPICRETLEQVETTDEYSFGKTSFYKQEIFTDILKKYPEQLEQLQTFISKTVKMHTHYYGYDNDKIDYGLTSIWVSQMNKGGYHEVHHHLPGPHISGNFFINSDENSSPLTFVRTTDEISHFNCFPKLPKRPLKQREGIYEVVEQKLEPKVGRLYVFNSNLLHKVTPNKSDDRICISFNIMMLPKGLPEDMEIV
jgi:uncharacterized protein (TIGR02466 family)